MTEPTSTLAPPSSTPPHVYGIRWEMGKRFLLTWLELPSTLSDAEVLDQVRLYANLSQAKVTRVFRKSGPTLFSDTRDIPPEDPVKVANMAYNALKAFIGYRSSTATGRKFTVKVPWVKDHAMSQFNELLKSRAVIGSDGDHPDYGIIVGVGIQRKHNASL